MPTAFDLTNYETAEASCMTTGKTATVKLALDFLANPTGSGDTIKAMIIPAGYEVQGVFFLINTEEAHAYTLAIGDSSSATVYNNGAVIGATSGTALQGVLLYGDAADGDAPGSLVRKYYSAANYILITPNNALVKLKGDLIVKMEKMGISALLGA